MAIHTETTTACQSEQAKIDDDVTKNVATAHKKQPQTAAGTRSDDAALADKLDRLSIVTSAPAKNCGTVEVGDSGHMIYWENTVDEKKFNPDFDWTDQQVGLEYLDDCTDFRALGNDPCDCKAGDDAVHGVQYGADGRLEYLDSLYIFECNDSCGCSESCANRVVQRGSSVDFGVFKTPASGWAARALQVIPAGTFIVEYTGRILSEEEDSACRRVHGHSWYTFDLDSFEGVDYPYVIDARFQGNQARFLNHCCEENCRVRVVASDNVGGPYVPRVAIFARRDIEKGEELTIDYGYHVNSDPEFVPELCVRCHCGAASCKKYLLRK